VTVSTQSISVESTRTATASTLDQRTIEATPILGRKFEDLLTLTPGVSVVQGPDGDEITFSGQRGVFNNISLDGGDYNNGFFGEQMGGQRAAIDITLEAVKEFQVVATGANAEYGRTAGGVVNVITKSGTNQSTATSFTTSASKASRRTPRTKTADGLQPNSSRNCGGPIEGQGVLLSRLRRYS
jgi:outer membrane receptor for ferrienterochelin and colicin